MKTILIVASFVLVLFLSRKGYLLNQKANNAEKLEYALVSATTPNLTIGRIIQILDGKDTNPLLLEVREKVINPTSSKYIIDQINLQILTPSGKTIVWQKEPLANPFTILPKEENNVLDLTFSLNPAGLKALVQEAGGAIKIGSNKLTSGLWGIKFRLKGTISTEGFDIPLDEEITM